MTKPNDNAFPKTVFEEEISVDCVGGLTKREYFAARALQGLLANESFLANSAQVAQKCPKSGKALNSGTLTAETAVLMADNLIEQLNK